VAEFAYEPEPDVFLAPGESVQEISGKSPWRLAGRRLLRNRSAMASLAVFLGVVAVSFAAPVYAHHIAHTDPFATMFANGSVSWPVMIRSNASRCSSLALASTNAIASPLPS